MEINSTNIAGSNGLIAVGIVLTITIIFCIIGIPMIIAGSCQKHSRLKRRQALTKDIMTRNNSIGELKNELARLEAAK